MTEINPVEAVLDREFPTPEARRAAPVTVVCMTDGWQVLGVRDLETTGDAMVATAMALVFMIADTAKSPSDAMGVARTFSEKIMQGVLALTYGEDHKDELRADMELLNASSRIRMGGRDV